MGIDLVGDRHSQPVRDRGQAGRGDARRSASYSTWFNGGARTTTGFHNKIGILTEISGNPTPIEIGLVLDRQLPHQDLPMPIPPQTVWHQRQSIDYILSVNRAILDVASKHREDFLYRIYRMGKNSIERGSRTTGRSSPTGSKRRRPQAAKRQPARRRRGGAAARGGGRGGVGPKYYDGDAARRSGAIRAATSSRRTSRTSSRPRSSSTR